MSQHKSEDDIYQMATDLKEFAEHFKIKMTYIHEQTGIPEKK